MRPRTIAVFVCLFFALACAGVRAESNDPSELFLNGYQSAQKGEKYEGSSSVGDALKAYQDAAQQLDQIRTRFPTWNPSIVEYRLKRVQDAITRLQKKGGAAPAIATPRPPRGEAPVDPPTIFPPEAEDGPGSAPPILKGEGTPSRGKPGRTTNPDLDPLEQMKLERQKLREDLERAQADAKRAREEEDKVKRESAAERAAKEAAIAKANSVEGRAEALEKALTEARTQGVQNAEKVQTMQTELKKYRSEVSNLREESEAREMAETQRAKQLRTLLAKSVAAAEAGKAAEQKAANVNAQIAAAEKKAETAIAAAKEETAAAKENAKKEIGKVEKERDEIKKELVVAIKQRDDAQTQLKTLSAGSAKVEQLLAENRRLVAKLDDADKRIKQYEGEAVQKDQLIASLRQEVGEVKKQLADSQKQSALFQTQMVDLKNKLETASADLAKQKTTTAAAETEKKKMVAENDMLRIIVMREMDRAARRTATSRAILEEVRGTAEEKATKYAREIKDLGQPMQLSAKEKALFKNPRVDLENATDFTIVRQENPVTPTAPAEGTPAAPVVPSTTTTDEPPAVNPAPTNSTPVPATPVPASNKRGGANTKPATATPPAMVKLDSPVRPITPPTGGNSPKSLTLDRPSTDILAPLPEAVRPAPPTAPVETPVTGGSSKSESMPSGISPGLPPEMLPLVQHAKDEFERGHYREAEQTYDEILRKSPNNLYGLSNKGVVLYRQQKYKPAEEAFRKAIAIAPEDGFSHCTIGIVYYVQNKYDDAVNELTKALAINPKNATAHNYLGITASQKGWPEAAQKELETAVALDPTYADAWFNLSVVYATRQPPDKENARRCYKKATELGAEADPSLEQIIK